MIDSSRDGSPRNSRLLEDATASRGLPVIVEVPANNNGYVLAQTESLSVFYVLDFHYTICTILYMYIAD